MKREYKYEDGILYLKCMKCWERMTSDKYNKDSDKSFWLRTDCRECQHKYAKIYRDNNKDKVINSVKRWQSLNKDTVDRYKKNYRDNNKDKVSKCQKNNRDNHSSELWFNWCTFHTRAIQFVRKYWLRPKSCPICWSWINIVMHHPSYDSFDKRSEVIFCCQSCHKLIHTWDIACPEPINLLELIN